LALGSGDGHGLRGFCAGILWLLHGFSSALGPLPPWSPLAFPQLLSLSSSSSSLSSSSSIIILIIIIIIIITIMSIIIIIVIIIVIIITITELSLGQFFWLKLSL
jgi:hypothetical protein